MRAPEVSPATYRRITVAALVALAFIIVTGAAVRLTESGLGCPQWPACTEGSLVPRGEAGAHDVVEFANRTITGLVSLAVIVAVLAARWRRPYRTDLVWWAAGLVAGVLAQIVLGGIVVLVELDPLSVIGHFLLSIVLVWNAVMLHHRASAEPGPTRPRAVPEVLAAGRLLVAAAAIVIVTGTVVTATGPHGGDAEAERLPFFITDVARIHGLAMVLFLGLTLATLWMIGRGGAERGVERRGHVLLAALAVQALVGYVQYFTGVPVVLVGVHVLGAVLVWIAVLRFHLGLRVVDAGSIADVTADAVAAAAAR